MADKTEESGQVRPIIVIKRKAAGHGGHHGGAWKVAYADFVTALMALFIVLWLMGQDKEIQKAIASYFSTPAGPGQQTRFAIPSGPGKQVGTEAAGVGNAIEIPKEDMSKLREKIQEALKLVPNFLNLKDHVEITITADGLRIELLETEAGIFFESGRPVPTKSGSQLIGVLAGELGKLPNGVMIEGHTDAKPYSSDGTYSNWDLSTDRANAARRVMEASGLRANQVSQIRGFADRQLRHPADPMTASNRRISVIVQYMPAPGDGDGTKPVASPPGERGGGGTKPSAAAPAPGNAKPAAAPPPGNAKPGK
jgi:chemotaxis protein MotB